MSTSKCVGIDLGTTFSALAQINEEGEPVPIQNEDGDIETASLILEYLRKRFDYES